MPDSGTAGEERANRLVAAFVLRDFLEDRCPDPCTHPKHTWAGHAEEAHLAACPTARVEHHRAWDTACGTGGCELMRLTAGITCDHGHQVTHDYGEFGSMDRLIARIVEDEQDREEMAAFTEEGDDDA